MSDIIDVILRCRNAAVAMCIVCGNDVCLMGMVCTALCFCWFGVVVKARPPSWKSWNRFENTVHDIQRENGHLRNTLLQIPFKSKL
jgi:hypothetical protein